MSRRVFYVVYFEDQNLQRILDAIRLLCDPNGKTRAHITIRGPYSKRTDMSPFTRRLQGTEIVTLGVDCFFNESQNTVFLKCDSDRLREVWEKSDYGYNPHITLYDGDSRQFASRLADRLSKLLLRFSFTADGLSPLISYKGQGTFDLRMAFDEEFVFKLIGKRVTSGDIEKLPVETRLSYVEALARKLPEITHSYRQPIRSHAH